MIFDQLLGRDLRAGVSWEPWDPRWYAADPGAVAPTTAGFPVTASSANRVSAVFACNSLILETLAATPCVLYRRRDDGGKERARNHPAYRTVRNLANPGMLAMELMGMMQGHTGLRGMAAAEIQDRGDRLDLIPLPPQWTIPEQLPSGRLRFRVRNPRTGDERVLLREEVLLIRDTTWDGVYGQSRAALAREAIAVAAAGEAFVGGFFRNDASGRVVFKHPGPGVPTEPQRKEIREGIDQQYAGWQRARRAMILYGGMEATELGGPDESAFLTDPRKFQIADIARYWRVPGFMIGLEEKSTSWGSGLEQQMRGFVTFTMRYWYTLWQESLSRDLLAEDEQEEYFFEFILDDLLRGDTLQLVQALAIERMNGALSPNEWRLIRNRNPRDDEGGDEFQDTPTGATPNGTGLGAGGDRGGQADAGAIPEPILADAAQRILSAETRELPKRPKAALAGQPFLQWVRTFYARHREYVARVLQPVAAAYGVPSAAVEATVAQLEARALVAMDEAGPPADWATRRQQEIAEVLATEFRPILLAAA